MKKLFSFLVIVSLLACSSIVPNVQGAAFLGNADPLSRSCASQFARMLPNYCATSVSPSSANLTLDTTCRALDTVAAFGYPSTTTFARFNASVHLVSTNAAGLNEMQIIWYTDSGCTVGAFSPTMRWFVREQTAIAAGNALLSTLPNIFELNLGSNATIYYIGTLTKCTNCTLAIFEMGYYD